MKLSFKNVITTYFFHSLVLFIVYYFTASYGLTIGAVSKFATLVWPPTGLAFVALYLYGLRLWPAIALAAFLVNFHLGASFEVSMGMATGNVLEAVTAAYIFKKMVGPQTSLEKVWHVTVLIFFVALGSTLISSIIGVTSLYLGGKIPYEEIAVTWRAWWVGDSVSNLVIAPFLLVWSRPPKITLNPAKILEGVGLFLTVILLSLIIFSPWPDFEYRRYVLPYWIILLLVWTTLRFDQYINTVVVLVVSSIAIWGTLEGFSPFRADTTSSNLLLLQLFISAAAVSGLFFGALGREKAAAFQQRSDFVSIASHELKTPITSLKLQIEVIKKSLELNPPINESFRILKVVNSTELQLRRLSILVSELLDTSQIESEALKLVLKETNLTDLIIAVAKDLECFVEEANCSVRFELEPSLSAVVDRHRLEQVIVNLLMNATKYGAGKEIKISLTRHIDKAVISVQDQGRGILRDDHKRIFDRFERVEARPTVNGLGLGLYICKKIVQAHKGRVWVESELNRGANFKVEIPLNLTAYDLR